MASLRCTPWLRGRATSIVRDDVADAFSAWRRLASHMASAVMTYITSRRTDTDLLVSPADMAALICFWPPVIDMHFGNKALKCETHAYDVEIPFRRPTCMMMGDILSICPETCAIFGIKAVVASRGAIITCHRLSAPINRH